MSHREVEGRIAELWVYPIKACRGVRLEEAVLEAKGLAHDRRWMIVTPDGRFLTQRELPRLALVRPSISGGTLSLRVGEVTLAPPEKEMGERLRVRVWGDEVDGIAASPEGDAALSDFLEQPVRLVRFANDARRLCDPAYAPEGAETGFADGFPLLVTSEASLEELNTALAERGSPTVPMRRFRPNIVLSGVHPRAEDERDRLVLENGVEIALVKRCDRCVVTTIDPDRGEKTGKEPLATLGRIRRNVPTGGAWFGQNGVPLVNGGGPVLLRAGMNCRLLSSMPAQPEAAV